VVVAVKGAPDRGCDSSDGAPLPPASSVMAPRTMPSSREISLSLVIDRSPAALGATNEALRLSRGEKLAA
jgi:hypothetical protein